MRTLLWTVAVMLLARPTVADPAASELDDLLREDGCRVPLSLHMPKAPLSRVFDTVGALNPRCAIRFDVDPDVAVLQASLELKDVRLATVLDVLAGNHDLVYAVSDGKVRVRRKPPVSAKAVYLEMEVGSDPAPSFPRVSVQIGQCATYGFGRRSGALKLDPETASLKPEEEPILRAHLCPERGTTEDLHLLADFVLKSSTEDGYRSREEHVIVRRTIGNGEKDVSLFKAPDGSVHVTLKGFAPVRPRPADATGGSKP